MTFVNKQNLSINHVSFTFRHMRITSDPNEAYQVTKINENFVCHVPPPQEQY